MKKITLLFILLFGALSAQSQNCNYTVSAMLVAGQPNMILFSFVNASSTATNFTWNFGDGNSSTQPTTFHTYAQAGTYYYCLTIDNCAPVCDSVVVITVPGCNDFFVPVVNNNTVQIYPYNLSGQYETFVDWGDNTIDTLTYLTAPNSYIHTYANVGSYEVCFTHRNSVINCSNTRCETVVIGSIGIAESVLSQTKIYPNPVTEALNISLPESTFNTEARIYNVNGNLIKVVQLENIENRIEVMSLPAGMYILKLQSQKDSYQMKFIKY